MDNDEQQKLEESQIERARSMTLKELNVLSQFLATVDDGVIERMQEFLEENKNLNINKYDHRGQTALHVASSSGHCEVIEFLISRGADASILNKKGDHVIHPAARNGHVGPLKLFKKLGVDLDLKNKNGETALLLATRSNHLQVVEFLCSEGVDVNLHDKNGETALHISCWYGQQPLICKTLCSHNCNLNVKNKECEAPIHFASGRGNLDFVKILIEHKADINITDKRGATPLHLACRRNHSHVALALLRAGCQTDVIDQLGETPLHPACHNNLVPVVQTMCAYGCKVDVVNKSGACPLHISTRTGHIEAVRCLLLSGVPAHLPNQQGVTAEVVAISQGHNEIAELIGGLKDKQTEFIRQLLPNEVRLERIKVKLFGHSGAGKSTLVESLKCGFLGSLLRKAGLGGGQVDSSHAYCRGSGPLSQQKESETAITALDDQTTNYYDDRDKKDKKKKKKRKSPSFALARRMSKDTKIEDVTESTNRQYTKGIAIQQTNIPGVGDVSTWEFSGFEPFHVCYDHFIGDTNCLHLVVFRATEEPEEQMRQIAFWLEFVRIRLPSHESIGKMGRSVNPASVILVATFCNEVKMDEEFRARLNGLHFDAVTVFSRDFSIHPRIICVDGQQPMSHEMKALKTAMHDAKVAVLQHIPATTHLLTATRAILPTWQRQLNQFPVVTWTNFKEYICLNVNPLACEEHLKSLVYYLQLAGEVVFLEYFKEGDNLVVISPKWLGQHLLATVLDRNPQLDHLHSDGILTRRDLFQDVFHGECEDLEGHVEVMEALELLAPLEEEFDDVVYELASRLRLSRPPEREIWDPEDVRFLTGPEAGEGVFGGLRLVPFTHDSKTQLRSIFPRVQTAARRRYDSYKAAETTTNDCDDQSDDERQSLSNAQNDIFLWQGGFKCTRGNLEVLVTEERDAKAGEWIDVKARGQREMTVDLFYFFHETLAIVLSAFGSCAPSLEFQHHYMSPGQLSEYRKQPDVYPPKDIILAKKCGKERVKRSESMVNISDKLKNQTLTNLFERLKTQTMPDQFERQKSSTCEDSTDSMEESAIYSETSSIGPEREKLTDILTFGSRQIFDGLVVGLDTPLSHLPVEVRRRLCAILDPPNPTGQDWCLLSVILGQSDELALIDGPLKEAFSKTDQILKRWSQADERPNVGMLLDKLEKIGRLDAVDILINITPVAVDPSRTNKEPPASDKSPTEKSSVGRSSTDGDAITS